MTRAEALHEVVRAVLEWQEGEPAAAPEVSYQEWNRVTLSFLLRPPSADEKAAFAEDVRQLYGDIFGPDAPSVVLGGAPVQEAPDASAGLSGDALVEDDAP